jgi:catechol 2,3-dioxygenase-like lactoylglutathione lyase family enzyme
MAVEKLDHYSVRTEHLARAVDFYEQALGLQKGPRPPFNFPGAWLYRSGEDGAVTGTAVVHIVGTASDGGTGLSDYLGNKPASHEAGSGALDHVAFVATDISGLYARLARHHIAFRERKVPGMELHQVFVDDPDGVTIELNYARPEDIAAGARNLASMAPGT